jgi:hypothetical protein
MLAEEALITDYLFTAEEKLVGWWGERLRSCTVTKMVMVHAPG